ncbi:MAG TPA: hypothetical protein VJ853_13945 [Thermoanaerobaculia bacterium]|nr:hypothetical protein [Thermoanaerobaculia bacterium]
MRRRAAIIVFAFAVLSVIVVPVFPHFVSPNEFTRWALASSLVERGTMEVSQSVAALGPRFEDVASVNGRLYSNKAPGAALLGTIGYLAARPFTTSLRALVNAMRLTASTLPVILLALLLMHLAGRFHRADRSPIVIAALLFGTPMLAYGLLLFAHALVAACLFAAWAFLFVEEHPIAAGALIGMAVLSEYPAAIPAFILIAAAATNRDWRRIGKVIAGGVPFAAALALYQYLCF